MGGGGERQRRSKKEIYLEKGRLTQGRGLRWERADLGCRARTVKTGASPFTHCWDERLQDPRQRDAGMQKCQNNTM